MVVVVVVAEVLLLQVPWWLCKFFRLSGMSVSRNESVRAELGKITRHRERREEVALTTENTRICVRYLSSQTAPDSKRL